MPVTIQPTFDVFDYLASNCDISKWRDEGQVRGSASPVPRSDIARAIEGYGGPRVIAVDGNIIGDGWSSRDDTRVALDAFGYAHRPGYRKLQKDTDRYLMAEVRSFTVGDDTGLLAIPFSVRFECPDPHYYATAADSDAWAPGGTGATRTIANGGSVATFPRFKIVFSSTATVDLDLINDTLRPGAPTLATATTGGTLAAGTYWVKVSWLLASGETVPGVVASQVTTGSTSTITVTAPAAPAGAVGFYVYCGLGAGEPADSAKWRQGLLVPIGQTMTFGTLATSGTAATTPSGGSIRIDGAVTANDVLYVDCAAQTVLLQNANKMSYFGGQFFPLNPGNNSLRAVYSGATISAIDTAWRKRWL